MQNLFICKFSALKIQFFPSVSVLPPSRTPLSSHPPRHPASFLVGTCLLDLGGTRALVRAWYGEGLADETECAVQAVRFGNVASPVQSSFLGIVPAGVYCQICILKKVLPRRLWSQDTLRRKRTRQAQNPCWSASADCGQRRALTAQPSGGQRGKYY